MIKLLAAIALLSGSAIASDPVFERSVKPILDAQCAACHSTKSKTSGYSVASVDDVIAGGNKFGRAVVPGHPEQSALVKMLKGELQPQMPFGKSLPPAGIAAIETWIKGLTTSKAPAAAEWRWPYQKPARHTPPAVQNEAWVRNTIDRFTLAKLEQAKIPPASEASRRTLARRVYFDLIGLPPSPAELDAFLSDQSLKSYENLIERLLADPRYGERWGRHWLDLVRYGETSGLEGDGAIGNAWRYRDWVINAFNTDLPYDQFVIQQLGGADEHSKTRNNYAPNVQGHVPLGFLRVAPWDRSNLVADEVRANYLAEITGSVSSVFMGLTVGCARCHDHKYDPIPQRDYYRFQAFFNTIQVDDTTVPYADQTFAAKAAEKVSYYEKLLNEGPEKKELEKLQQELLPILIAGRKKAAAGKELTKDDVRLEMRRAHSPVFTAGEQQAFARILEDADRTQDAEEKEALDKHEATMLARLKEAYAKPGADPMGRFEALTTGDVAAEAGRLSSKYFDDKHMARHKELTAALDVYGRRLGRWRPVALTVRNVPGPPNGPMIAPIRVLRRGDYRLPADAVEPGFPTAFTGKEENATLLSDRYRQFPTRGWRLTLARWIASADHPLTARVMVNRIWQHHFGRGIVATPSDFGKNGSRPTHPELLDWLALQFVDSGWSVKAMHRLMLTSATYRQAAENPAAAKNTADPENHLLWKHDRRRLEAEALRDSVLAVSGRLNPEMYGPSMFPPLPEDLADFARYGRTGGLMWEPNEKEEDARRRSIYVFQRRSLPLPLMASFDALPFSESCDRRSVTTTPLQALSMMNGNLIHEEAQHLAHRVEREAGASKEAQVRRAFNLVLNRDPQPTELARFAQFNGKLDALCRVLLNSNEFLYLD
ncbi:MAG: PSD1 domain-containing protein [Bryobacterales bacterium]|nr:PSD1 domain-containing protein [Bryobacterales bacterium]